MLKRNGKRRREYIYIYDGKSSQQSLRSLQTRKKSDTPRPLYFVGLLMFSLALGAIVVCIILGIQNRIQRKELLSQQADTFVLYNKEQTNIGVPVNGVSNTDTYKEDIIQSMDKDQVVTNKTGTVVLDIPDLDIKVPVLDGIDNYTLSIAAGHFPDTGSLGKGNYCIAGHSSVVYDCIFNNLKDVKLGMQMNMISEDGVLYTYYVTESFVVEPEDVWVIDDYKDNRLTLITCTDGGLRRQVVVGLLMTEEEYKEYFRNQQSEKLNNIAMQYAEYADVRVSEYLERKCES